MALPTTMFAADFLTAQNDLPQNAIFDAYTLIGLFKKLNEQESVLMEGIEDNTTATFYVSKAQLDLYNIATIEIGDKCTINTKQYRVLALNPYPHGQYYRLDLTDLNS